MTVDSNCCDAVYTVVYYTHHKQMSLLFISLLLFWFCDNPARARTIGKTVGSKTESYYCYYGLYNNI